MKKKSVKRIIGVFMAVSLFSGCLPINVLADVQNNESEIIEVMPYLNTELTFEERSADLVSRLTLEEKVSQTVNGAAAIPRLGISAYSYWREALHGVARQGKATSFPTTLAMSNSWNRELIKKTADITSTEARGKNANVNLSYWSPTINMARDPRWGRNEETYGEDPYLTGELASKFVEGMQGDDEVYLKTIATVKHFVANNCEKERRGGTSVIDERTLREYYAKVFQNVVEKAHPASAMSSYNATTVTRNGETLYDYIPSAANPYTLTELLRRNWGFEGYVTGDCGAVQDVGGTSVGGKTDAYKKALFPDMDVKDISAAMAIAESFKAGNDIDCGSVGVANSYEAVIKGYMTENQLDINLYRLFLQRMKTGEFDEGSRYSDITSSVIETQEHIDVAEEAAEETWVLLKNQNNMLPISNDKKNIVLVGGLAGKTVLGDYSGEPENQITPYKGLTEQIKAVNPDATVNYLAYIGEDETLFNIKSLSFVLSDGSTRKVDISKATDIKGLTLQNNMFTDVTRNGTAIIKNVDFSNVVSVKAEIAAGKTIGGTIILKYGSGGPSVAMINSQQTDDFNTFAECTAQYSGASGGYNGTADLQISVAPNEDFSIEKYKAELDAADVIIAYTGTSEADSAESNDRSSILLPSSQYHVQQIVDNYGSKTIVAIQSVGQIDVTPFVDKVDAVLWTSYNGQTQGTAFGKVITGLVNPSGKLTTTWYTAGDLAKMPVNTTAVKGSDGLTRYYNDYSIRSNPSKDFPGRTYQYYTGSPVYPFGYGLSYTDFEYSNLQISKNNLDANDTFSVSVDVKNVGSVEGKEVVQIYVAPPNADGVNLPFKQLKNFDKVSLAPNQTKTVTFELSVKDFNFFDEVNQKIYVPTGEYTLSAAKNANDPNALTQKFNVSGELESVIKTVAAIPDGVRVVGIYHEGDETAIPENTVNSNVSCVMTDEVIYDIQKADVKYSSSDESVAIVDENGVVSPGTREGIAVISVTVTAEGLVGTDSFPVVCELKTRVTDEVRAEYLAKLDNEFKFCAEAAYSASNYQKVQYIYNNAKSELEIVLDLPTLISVYGTAVSDLRAVEQDKLSNVYSIAAENSEHMSNGKIEYGVGIPIYNATESSISGTVTSENPFLGIKLIASKDGTPVDSSKIKWKLEKLDDSKRNPADIDYETGELTIKENGLVKITAVNLDSLECGRAVILLNLQIEGEQSDDGNGANLLDNKSGASGSETGPNNAGSTAQYWLKFNGIRLEGLKQIIMRSSSKTDSCAITVSTAQNENVSNLIAKGTVQPTGAWNKWSETTFDVFPTAVESAVCDENGLTTIYIKTNGANLDYFRLVYEEEGKYPYTITSAANDSNGTVSVSLRHKLNSENGILIGSVYDENNKMVKTAQTPVSSSGTYSLDGNFSAGEKVSLFVWDNLENMNPISEVSAIDYSEPELIVYKLGDSAYSSWGGTSDGDVLPQVNGLSAYGGWVIAGGNVSYEYNGNTYNFSGSIQAGSGGTAKRSVYFTPKSECVVTVVFDGNSNAGREMYIAQNGQKLASGVSVQTGVTSFECKITDTSSPVYIYGGGSNKRLYGIFVEYK